MTRDEKIKAILLKTISTNPTHWSVISEAVKAEMVIKNWMVVRGVLQALLNKGTVKRVDDIYKEQYTQ